MLNQAQTIQMDVNDKVSINNTYHRLLQVVDGTFSFQAERTQAIVNLDHDSLLKGIYNDGNIIFAGKYKNAANNNDHEMDLEAYPEKSIRKAKLRQRVCKALEDRFGKIHGNPTLPEEETVDFLVQFARDKDIKVNSVRTTRSYYQQWWYAGKTFKSLLSDDWKKGSINPKLFSDQELMIHEAIMDIYLQRSRPNYKMIIDAVELYTHEFNQKVVVEDRISVPSESTIRNRIKKVDPYLRAKKRLGKEKADAMLNAFCDDPKYGGPTRPLEYTQMDHTKMDVMLKLPDNTCVRPWLTVILCQFTKMVLGCWISLKEPCGESALMCLRQSIKPKEGFLAGYPDISSSWPAHGKIENLVCDNGKEFYGEDFVAACNQLGIHLIYCSPNKPYQKGSVERIFRTFNEQFTHNLPSTTKSNVVKKGHHFNPADFASLTLQTLVHDFTKYIVDYYHRTFHRSTLMTPLDAWMKGVQENPVIIPNEAWRIDEITAPVARNRTLWQGGIDIYNKKYWNVELADIYRKAPVNVKYTVKWDPENNNHIWVLGDRDKYIEVPVKGGMPLTGMRVDEESTHQRALKAVANRAENIEAKREVTKAMVDNYTIGAERDRNITTKKNDERLETEIAAVVAHKNTKKKVKSIVRKQSSSPALAPVSSSASIENLGAHIDLSDADEV